MYSNKSTAWNTAKFPNVAWDNNTINRIKARQSDQYSTLDETCNGSNYYPLEKVMIDYSYNPGKVISRDDFYLNMSPSCRASPSSQNTWYRNVDAMGNPVISSLPLNSGVGIYSPQIYGIDNQIKNQVQLLPSPSNPCTSDPSCSGGIQRGCCNTNIGIVPASLVNPLNVSGSIQSTCKDPRQMCYPCAEGYAPVASGMVMQNGTPSVLYVCSKLNNQTTFIPDIQLILKNNSGTPTSVLYYESQQGSGSLRPGEQKSLGFYSNQISTVDTIALQGTATCICSVNGQNQPLNYSTQPIKIPILSLPKAITTLQLVGKVECEGPFCVNKQFGIKSSSSSSNSSNSFVVSTQSNQLQSQMNNISLPNASLSNSQNSYYNMQTPASQVSTASNSSYQGAFQNFGQQVDPSCPYEGCVTSAFYQ